MGLILIFLFVSLLIGFLIFMGNSSFRPRHCRDACIYGIIGFGVSALVLGCVVLAIWGISYSTYVDIRTKYDATLKQYKSAITMYADHATIDMEKAALTDLKYQGYQENVASFIKDLRREIVEYNEQLISKRVMKKNFMFNALIIAPDNDMMPISMLEEPNESK